MDAETLIGILFIVFFIVVPFIKEILKKNENEEQPNEDKNAYQESQSAQQIREYLEKMRGSSSPTPQKKNQPLHNPKLKNREARGKKQDTRNPIPETIPATPIAIQEAGIYEVKQVISTIAAPKIDPIHNVMADTRFSEAQKAIIFYEILKIPNFAEQNPQNNRKVIVDVQT